MTDNAVRCEAGAARHRFALRIYWEDTDAGGIVYYANYLKFMNQVQEACATLSELRKRFPQVTRPVARRLEQEWQSASCV